MATVFLFTLYGLTARCEVWTLDRVLEAAETNNFAIARANAKINEMKATEQVAISSYIPSLGLQSTLSSNEFVLSQKIYDGGASIASIDLSQHQTRLSEIEKTMQRQRIRTQAVGAYYDALFAKARRILFETSADESSAALAKAQTQYKYRAIGHDAILRAKIYYRRNNSDVFEAQREETTALRALARITRVPDFSADWLPTAVSVSEIPEPPSLDTTKEIDTLFPNLAEVHFLQETKNAMNAQKNFDMAADRINFSFLASYGLGQNAPSLSVNYVYAAGLQLGFTLTVPFFSGYSLLSKKKVYAQRQLEVDQDINAARDDFNFEYRERVSVLQKGWKDLQYIESELKASEDIYKESDANFRIGLTLPDIWFQSSENVLQWKLRELQDTKNYLIQYQILTDQHRTM